MELTREDVEKAFAKADKGSFQIYKAVKFGNFSKGGLGHMD